MRTIHYRTIQEALAVLITLKYLVVNRCTEYIYLVWPDLRSSPQAGCFQDLLDRDRVNWDHIISALYFASISCAFGLVIYMLAFDGS